MGIWGGLIQGATTAARGINQGKADAPELERQAREAERKALHDALAQKLMEAQISKMNAPPPPKARAAHYDQERGIVVYTNEDGPAGIERVADPRVPTAARVPREVLDPNDPEVLRRRTDEEIRKAIELAKIKPAKLPDPTGTEQKNAGLYEGAVQANANLSRDKIPTGASRLYSNIVRAVLPDNAVTGNWENYALTGKQEGFKQASSQFADMALKFTSGANSPQKEVENYIGFLIPQGGDEEATLQQKEEARFAFLRALKTAGGEAVDPNTVVEMLKQNPYVQQQLRTQGQAAQPQAQPVSPRAQELARRAADRARRAAGGT